MSYGHLDGEPIHRVTIKLKGNASIARRLADEERIVLTVTGIASPAIVRRVDGELVKEHVVTATMIAEPAGNLGDEVSDFLQKLNDEQQGRRALPFEDSDEEPGA